MTNPNISELSREFAGKIMCFFRFHDLKKDRVPINGVWWAFCSRCGARYGGKYDPMYGTTTWNPM